MRYTGISFLIPLVLMLTVPAHADELEHDAVAMDISTATEMVQSCLEETVTGDRARSSCIGVSVSTCSANALTTVDMLSCLTPEITVWEARMNTALEGLNAVYAEQDALEEPVRALAPRLTRYQEQWLAWRDAKCGFEYEKYRGGSLGRIASADCHLDTVAKRTLELEDLAEEAGF